MKVNCHALNRDQRNLGATLLEVLVSIAITAVTIAVSVNGYVMSAKRAEWSAYSLAAQSLAVQRLEQARAAKWDPYGSPSVDLVVPASFPPQVNVLDVPVSGTNIVYATNFTSITVISTNPPLKAIYVECVWPFMHGRIYTNSIISYRAPDQ